MKILHKNKVIAVCRDDHPDTQGWEKINIPPGFMVIKQVKSLKNEDEFVEVFKTIDEIKSELEALDA